MGINSLIISHSIWVTVFLHFSCYLWLFCLYVYHICTTRGTMPVEDFGSRRKLYSTLQSFMFFDYLMAE